MRGGARDFTHSRLMAWVAYDRAVRAVEEFGLQGPIDKWRGMRERIKADILENGWSDRRGAFVQYYGGETLDASLLMMPIVGFLEHDDPRIVGTVLRIRDELSEDGLILRYRTEHGHGRAGGRGRDVPRLLVLDGRCAHQDRPAGRGDRAVRPPPDPAQ